MKIKRIALIGSSGGGKATLGHENVHDFVQLISDHLWSIESISSDNEDESNKSDGKCLIYLETILFVSLNDGGCFDSATENDMATLLYMRQNNTFREEEEEEEDSSRLLQRITEDRSTGNSPTIKWKTPVCDSLKQINELVLQLDTEVEDIAAKIKAGKIHGLITVSCNPSLIENTLHAAAEHNIPVTGTGGSSLSCMGSCRYNLRLIGNSGGSVGTTPETKAISYASAFAEEWKLEYKPWKVKKNTAEESINIGDSALDLSSSWKSVLNSCLPGFWSVVLFKKFMSESLIGEWIVPNNEREILLFVSESYLLPILCAVTMASSSRRTNSTNSSHNNNNAIESLLMATVLAASTCHRTIIGGMLSGWLVSVMEEQLMYVSIVKWKLPATMTNLLRVFVGIIIGLTMMPFNGYLRHFTELYRYITMIYFWDPSTEVAYRMQYGYFRFLISSIMGCFFCYGSKVGWYHSIFLPMILVEMELGDPSMLGALDFLTLVLVSAGVCFGILLTSDSKEERNLARRGLKINLLYGDFVEACYPYMEQHPVVDVAGYVSSSLSVSVLSASCRSSAYMPFPLSIWLADDRINLTIASLIAFFVPFLATCYQSLYHGQNNNSKTD